MMSNSYDSITNAYAGNSTSEQPQPQRPVIKMPKAVASVTSVPTRADYQQQLEANLERKRKRLGDLGPDPDKKKGKRGRKEKEDAEYKPKIGSISSGENTNSSGKSSAEIEKQRKTRGKPPKKCLAEAEEEEPDDLKAQSMKFAEEIRAQFDEPYSQKSSKGRKKKRKGGSIPNE